MKTGYLQLYFGNMFAGKTTKLLTNLSIMADMGCRTAYINHVIDHRSGDDIVSSHSNLNLSVKVFGCKLEQLSQFNVDDYDVIGVDEGQFFSDLVLVVVDSVCNKGKHVIVSSLDADANQCVFGETLKLIPHADKYEKLTACCLHCFQSNSQITPAPFTAKLLNSVTTSQVDIGGADKYIPLCRYHLKLSSQSMLDPPTAMTKL